MTGNGVYNDMMSVSWDLRLTDEMYRDRECPKI